jgi:hypothetical protein
MSMKAINRFVFITLIGVLGVGCGGDDDTIGSGSDAVETCKQGCRTSQSLCQPDAGEVTSACENTCTARDGGTGPVCTNQSEITAAFKTCLQKTTCQDFNICLAAIPRCKDGTGDSGRH